MLTPLFETYRNQLPSVRAEEVALYQRHFELLCAWNEQINLVSRKSIDKAFGAHYADSLFIADFARRFVENEDVYDVGTGAGFPGVLFAIRYPELRVTLYEKILKKQTFLSAVIAQLGLSNVTLSGAAPEFPHRGLFLARAVFPPPELFKFMRRRLAPRGVLITNVGGKSESLVAPGGFKHLETLSYSLPLECGDRRADAFRFTPKAAK